MTFRFMIRAIPACFLLALEAMAAPLPASPSERALVFADCAGRYGAEATHFARPMDPEAADRQVMFELLLDAVMPAAMDYGMPRSEPARAKFHAWKSHAYLLNDALFATDAGRRDRAADRLAEALRNCDALIL